MTQSPQVRPRLRLRLLLIGVPMASGAGLVVHILAGFSLPLAVGVLAVGGLAVWIGIWTRLSAQSRLYIRTCVVAGAVGGLSGTVAYDLARYGTVAVFSMSFSPFHVFSLFGEAFLGAGHSATLLFGVGFAYHVCNGTFFGVAYALLFRRYTWWTGALWGMALEAAMASLYPSWLRIQMLREFLEVSVVGHLVYGAVLGTVASVAAGRLRDRYPR